MTLKLKFAKFVPDYTESYAADIQVPHLSTKNNEHIFDVPPFV